MSPPTRHDAAGRAYLDLHKQARAERRGTQEMLTLYAVERWLARLANSEYVGDFVLKGGMLLAAFGQRRPTVDVDTLARNMVAEQEAVAARVAEVAELPDAEDGIEFLTDTVAARTIRSEAAYPGVRVTMRARIATATIKFSIDVNFGDPVTPAPRLVELPALRRTMTPIRVLGYPVETVLAEKLATAIVLGAAKTRVRDFADIYTVTGEHDLYFASTRRALEHTAEFRDVTIQPLSAVVANIVDLRANTYAAYRKSLGPYGVGLPEHFGEVVTAAIRFADPLTEPHAGFISWTAGTRQWTSR
jgi:hypothetical protein